MKRLFLLAVLSSIASPTYGQVALGTSTSATNPQRSGDATTGLFSSTTGAVSVSSAGAEKMRVNGTGVGIGTTTPSFSLDVDTSVSTAAAFGTPFPIYLMPNHPIVGFNGYWNGSNWLFGRGSSGNYGGYIQLDETTGQFAFFQSSATGNAGNTATMNAHMVINQNGNVGIATTAPDAILSLGGQSAQTIDLLRETTASTAGNNLTVHAGGAVSGGTNLNGGNLILSSGASTGTGTSQLQFQVYPAGTSGTADNSATTAMIIIGAGAVGIGTTSPDSNVNLTLQSSGDAQLSLKNSTGTTKAYVGTAGVFGTGSADDLRIRSDASDILFGFSGFEKMRLTSGGNLGIGTTTPAQALEVNGEVQVDTWAAASATTVCKNGNVLSTCSSSLRYKENVKPLDMGLDQVMRMRPVKFKWKDRDETDFGLIAEDMNAIDPLYVTYEKGHIEGVKYPQITAVLINAVKEQQEEIADLKREIADLKVGLRKNQPGY